MQLQCSQALLRFVIMLQLSSIWTIYHLRIPIYEVSKLNYSPFRKATESECCHLSFSLHKTLFDQYFDTAIL